MEPVSVTASIITLLSASSTIAKFCERIAELRQAPEILLQLNNEVSELRYLIEQVKDLLRDFDITVLDSRLNVELQKLEALILELARFIVYDLEIPTQSGIRVDRSRFLRHASRAQMLKARIREEKREIIALLSS